MTKIFEQTLVILTNRFFKLATSYSCSNDCSSFCQFCSDLKILYNSLATMIVSGRNIMATLSVVNAVGVTKCLEEFLVILLLIPDLDSA